MVGPSQGSEVVSQRRGAASVPAATRFSFVISRALGTVVVTTHGLLDAKSARALGDALRDLIDHQGNLAVVVDVADLLVSDHLCVVPLAAAVSAAARRGGVLTFADPSESMARALMVTGLAGLVAMTTERRLPSPSRPPGNSGADARLVAMAQHPAGTATSAIQPTTSRQGAGP